MNAQATPYATRPAEYSHLLLTEYYNALSAQYQCPLGFIHSLYEACDTHEQLCSAIEDAQLFSGNPQPPEYPAIAYAHEVANTIHAQLGGNRFDVMTGSYAFTTYIRNNCAGLQMRLRRNSANARGLAISLDEATDTYTLYFYNKRNAEPFKTIERVYTEDLQHVFTSVTGLYTSL